MSQKILKCSRSSEVERLVEAQRAGGSIPSDCTIYLRSSVAERRVHTSDVDCSIQSVGTKFRCRITALRLTVNQVILVRPQAPEPFFPASSNGRTPDFDSENLRSNRRAGTKKVNLGVAGGIMVRRQIVILM